MLSCTSLDKISWVLIPWPRTSDFVVFNNSVSKPKKKAETTSDLYLLQYFGPMAAEMGEQIKFTKEIN